MFEGLLHGGFGHWRVSKMSPTSFESTRHPTNESPSVGFISGTQIDFILKQFDSSFAEVSGIVFYFSINFGQEADVLPLPAHEREKWCILTSDKIPVLQVWFGNKRVNIVFFLFSSNSFF